MIIHPPLGFALWVSSSFLSPSQSSTLAVSLIFGVEPISSSKARKQLF